MASPQVRVSRSSRRLSEVARHLVIPEGIVDTLWHEVVEQCAEFGDTFDPWQDGLGQAALGLREDGIFAATVGGVTFSIPRQVAKTFLVGRICVALCILFPNLTILWTAHHTRTTTNTFQKLKALVLRPAVRGHLKPGQNQGTAIRDANGEQEIPFLNGSRILFGARSQGFGRGFDEVDVEVFDEAQNLPVRALEDMVAATNQSRFVHGALLFYMGTPPRPEDAGEAFTERRTDALSLKAAAGVGDFSPAVESGDALYVECSADANVGRAGGPSLDDPKQIEKANPSYPDRTPPMAIKRLRKNLPSDGAWRREGLGVWDIFAGKPPAIDPVKFAERRVEVAPTGPQVAYGVKFSADGARMALAVALHGPECPFVEVLDSGSTSVGLTNLTEWLVARWRDCDAIVIDGKGAAGTLNELLLDAGVHHRKIIRPTWDGVVTANSNLVELVRTGGVEHAGQPGLTDAVEHCCREDRGGTGGWNFAPITPGADAPALQAVALALSGLGGTRNRQGKKRAGTRRAVFG